MLALSGKLNLSGLTPQILQVPRKLIGTDAFQETPIVEVTRQITKHNYLVMDLNDLPRIVKEAFYLARTGRPGPVLIDVPKDVQQQLAVPDWDVPMAIAGYMGRLPQAPLPKDISPIIRALKEVSSVLCQAFIRASCKHAVSHILARRSKQSNFRCKAANTLFICVCPVEDTVSSHKC